MATNEEMLDLLESVRVSVDIQTESLLSASNTMVSEIQMTNKLIGKLFDLQKEDLSDKARQERLAPSNTTTNNTTNNVKEAEGFGAKVGVGVGGILGGVGAGLGILSKFVGVGAGLAALGVGIGGFFTGLAASDAAIAKLGDGANLKTLITNVGSGLGELDADSLKALGGLLVGTTLFATLRGPVGSIKTGVGMTALGFGIGGFMTGMVAAGDITGFKGEIFAAQAKNIASGIKEFSSLDSSSLAGIAAIAGAGALIGGVSTKVAGKAAVGMGAAGLGIGGFMAGLVAAGDLTGFTGEGFATQAKNVAEGMKAFNDVDGTTVAGLTAMAGLGALTFAVPGGALVGALATAGMAAAGFGIGAFVTGLAAAGDIGKFIGVDGSGLKNTMSNLAEGFKSFNGIDGSNFADIGKGMMDLGPGLLVFMGTQGIGGITDTIMDTFKSVWSWITGEDTNESEGRFASIVRELEVFNTADLSGVKMLGSINLGAVLTDLSLGLNKLALVDYDDIEKDEMLDIMDGLDQIAARGNDASFKTGITATASAIDTLTQSLFNLGALNLRQIGQFSFTRLSKDLVGGANAFDVALNGGTLETGLFSSDITIKNGLASQVASASDAAKAIGVIQDKLLRTQKLSEGSSDVSKSTIVSAPSSSTVNSGNVTNNNVTNVTNITSTTSGIDMAIPLSP